MIRSIPWLVAMLLAASPAFAHAFLERADPPVGSDLPTAPQTMTLRFTEGIEPRFSTIEIRDANGAVVAIGKPHTAPGNDRELLVALPELHKGRYTVTWHATSVDTHKTEGSFQFNIAP
jgi:methionine-rich copper-binding protein CopC